MIVLRIVGFIVLLVLGGCFVVFLVTKDRRWLRFAAQLLRFSVIVLAVFMALYLFERLVMFV